MGQRGDRFCHHAAIMSVTGSKRRTMAAEVARVERHSQRNPDDVSRPQGAAASWARSARRKLERMSKDPSKE
jgi:hypothetical protein